MIILPFLYFPCSTYMGMSHPAVQSCRTINPLRNPRRFRGESATTRLTTNASPCRAINPLRIPRRFRGESATTMLTANASPCRVINPLCNPRRFRLRTCLCLSNTPLYFPAAGTYNYRQKSSTYPSPPHIIRGSEASLRQELPRTY